MKLRSSTTSPFARKCRIAATETGTETQITIVPTSPVDAASGLGKDNPLNKIPVLVLDNGETLYDSAVICEYLDSLHQGTRLFPAPGPERWQALRRQALADGMMDAAILRMIETRRPEAKRSHEWDQRQKLKIEQGLAALEAESATLSDKIDIGTLSIACALDYLDFRFKEDNWREKCPGLVRWHQRFSTHASLQRTLPHE